MAESRIPVDLLNPGQVFACLGLMEATEGLVGACEGVFAAGSSSVNATFHLTAPGEVSPLAGVLSFLKSAEVLALAPRDSDVSVKEPGVVTQSRSDFFFPSESPDSPAALPIRLQNANNSVPVEHWADGSSRDNVKFWAGAGGYSGAALARDALMAIAGRGPAEWERVLEDPFNFEAPMSSSFRFDWRRDYVPLDLGFSLNAHSSIRAVGFPLVELLAAIGLQHARPARVTARDKLLYRYAAWTSPLSTALARCVFGGADLGFPVRRFKMRLGWPGQEGQARCIVDAQEE
jgi:CRISPR-associated protein Csb3